MSPFLVEYDRPTGDVKVTKYEDFASAFAARIEKERTRTDSNLEIVVIRSESLDELRKSHSRYFMRERSA